MISIIICSRHEKLSIQLQDNIRSTIGVEYEIISIDNSQNEYYITQAYNKGLELSKFDYLCFIHEDVEFKTKNWGTALIDHLNNNPRGLIGLAGGQIATKSPSSWSSAVKFQRKNYEQNGTFVSYPQNIKSKTEEVVMLDGFFISCKKEFIAPIRFNEALHGFHAYDADICFRSKANNGINLVIYDVLVAHHSGGTPNRQWVECTKKVFQTWNHILPIYVGGESIDMNKIEQENLKRFIKRMIKFGYSYSDVVNDLFLNSLWEKSIGKTKFSLKFLTLYYLLFKVLI